MTAATPARGPARPATPARLPAPPPARALPARGHSAAGQATVELVALLPLALLVALTIGQFMAAGAAGETAGNAAEAGAVAMLQGTDPTAAARAALPGWSRDRTVVRIHGRRIEIRIRPRTVIPLLANRLEAAASADAGPER